MKRSLKALTEDLVREIWPLVIHDRFVTENIFVFIEQNSDYRRRYDELIGEFSRDPVNNWIGRGVINLYQLKNNGKQKAKRTMLITEFTLHQLTYISIYTIILIVTINQ
ncbi:MAG: hypothetical protein KBC43_11945 [Bacteroidales bacterium]|nr:hypothetical protein [Bacteroidales bacterium]